jgi:uncharacterized membrane protein YdjX (TVP38/TMEM64 family)
MKTAFKIGLGLGAFFTSTLLVNHAAGWLTIDSVRAFIETLSASPQASLWIGLAVFALLSVDSVIAVPTTATIVLGGFFLGPLGGGLVAACGLMFAGSICYAGGRAGGDRFLHRLMPADELAELRVWFGASGSFALLVARALPMLPEVLSCLAGMSRISYARYLLTFAAGNLPYAFLAAWAGSISDFSNPWPALAVGVGVPALAWIAWFFMNPNRRAGARSNAS